MTDERNVSRRHYVKHTVAGVGIAAVASVGTYYATRPTSIATETSNKISASGHPEWWPIMWQDNNRIVGAGPDLLTLIAHDLGLELDVLYQGTWDQVLEKVKQGQVDMLVAAYKTSDREQWMDYSIPYATDPAAIFVKKGRAFPFEKWEDLIGKNGIATVGDSYGQEFDTFMEKLSVTRVTTAKEAFAALEEERGEYFIFALRSGQKILSETEYAGKFEYLNKIVTEQNFYITISKQSRFTSYLPNINELIQEYRDTGIIDALIKKNME